MSKERGEIIRRDPGQLAKLEGAIRKVHQWGRESLEFFGLPSETKWWVRGLFESSPALYSIMVHSHDVTNDVVRFMVFQKERGKTGRPNSALVFFFDGGLVVKPAVGGNVTLSEKTAKRIAGEVCACLKTPVSLTLSIQEEDRSWVEFPQFNASSLLAFARKISR